MINVYAPVYCCALAGLWELLVIKPGAVCLAQCLHQIDKYGLRCGQQWYTPSLSMTMALAMGEPRYTPLLHLLPLAE